MFCHMVILYINCDSYLATCLSCFDQSTTVKVTKSHPTIMSLPEDDKLKSSNGKMTKEPNGTTSNPATYDPTMHEEIIREFSTLRTSLEKLEKCVRKSMPLKVNDGEVMGSSETNMPQTTNFSKLQHQGSSTPLDPKPKVCFYAQ